jgi:hypothetical protein
VTEQQRDLMGNILAAIGEGRGGWTSIGEIHRQVFGRAATTDETVDVNRNLAALKAAGLVERVADGWRRTAANA